MGLGAVELLMAIEDNFAISIEDADVDGVRTVGDLERLVQQKLRPQTSKTCLTSFTFYRLRSAAAQQFGVARGDVRLDTSLDDLVPRERRRDAWSALKGTVGWRLPELRRRPAVGNTIVALSLLAIVAAVVGGALVSRHSTIFG